MSGILWRAPLHERLHDGPSDVGKPGGFYVIAEDGTETGRRLAMAILSSLRGVDASTSSAAFGRAWRAATIQIARRRPRLAVWTPEQIRLRAAGYVVLPEGYRP